MRFIQVKVDGSMPDLGRPVAVKINVEQIFRQLSPGTDVKSI